MEGSAQYSGYIDPSYGARSRLVDAHAHSSHGAGALGGPGAGHQASITSELEGDKMVLKIAKPPRDKDSLMSLTWQCCSWMVTVIIGPMGEYSSKCEGGVISLFGQNSAK